MLGDGTENSYNASKLGIRYAALKLLYQEANIGSNPPPIDFTTIKDNVYGFWEQPTIIKGDN